MMHSWGDTGSTEGSFLGRTRWNETLQNMAAHGSRTQAAGWSRTVVGDASDSKHSRSPRRWSPLPSLPLPGWMQMRCPEQHFVMLRCFWVVVALRLPLHCVFWPSSPYVVRVAREAHALSTQVLECREQLRQRVKKKQPTRPSVARRAAVLNIRARVRKTHRGQASGAVAIVSLTFAARQRASSLAGISASRSSATEPLWLAGTRDGLSRVRRLARKIHV